MSEQRRSTDDSWRSYETLPALERRQIYGSRYDISPAERGVRMLFRGVWIFFGALLIAAFAMECPRMRQDNAAPKKPTTDSSPSPWYRPP